MATATKIQLVEFNKDEALNGASLAFSSNGQLSGTVSDYVLNFQLNDISMMNVGVRIVVNILNLKKYNESIKDLFKNLWTL